MWELSYGSVFEGTCVERRPLIAGTSIANKETPGIKTLVSAVLAGSFLVASLAACNTIQGAGKDIERGGEKIQKEAVEHKRY